VVNAKLICPHVQGGKATTENLAGVGGQSKSYRRKELVGKMGEGKKWKGNRPDLFKTR